MPETLTMFSKYARNYVGDLCIVPSPFKFCSGQLKSLEAEQICVHVRHIPSSSNDNYSSRCR